jgi:hypothetical protein
MDIISASVHVQTVLQYYGTLIISLYYKLDTHIIKCFWAGERERGCGVGSPLVRGSAQFAIRFDFVKLSGCQVWV